MEDLEQQFYRIIEENKLRILRITRVYARDPDDRKDLYQEVILNIWKSIRTVKDPDSLNTWVYRVCLNVCMQYNMQIKSRNKGRISLEGLIISDSDSHIEEDLEKREIIGKLYHCIGQLTGIEKSLILLYLEDLPYKNIAEITGLTENHVAVRLARIRRKILNCIDQ